MVCGTHWRRANHGNAGLLGCGSASARLTGGRLLRPLSAEEDFARDFLALLDCWSIVEGDHRARSSTRYCHVESAPHRGRRAALRPETMMTETAPIASDHLAMLRTAWKNLEEGTAQQTVGPQK
jgi:hypothetical protein